MEYLKLDSAYGVYLSQRGIFSPNEISQILKINKQDVFDCIKENNNEDKAINNLNKINKMAYFEITKYMEGQLLRDSDVFGMSNSIEIRVPFLNQKLVEAVLSVNHKYKFDNNIRFKRVLYCSDKSFFAKL